MGAAGTRFPARDDGRERAIELRPEERSASDVPALLPDGHDEQPGDHRAAEDVRCQERATPAQVSLAWLLAQKPWIVPIPGTSNLDHLRENVDAVKVELTPADLRELEAALSRIEIYGGRMDARQMAQIGQDVD